jgi:hypothetical protein
MVAAVTAAGDKLPLEFIAFGKTFPVERTRIGPGIDIGGVGHKMGGRHLKPFKIGS